MMRRVIDTFPNGLLSQRLEMSPEEQEAASRRRPELYEHPLFGMKVYADETVPPGEMRFVQDNRIVARIVGLAPTPTETASTSKE